MGRHEEARQSLDQALAERGDLILARQEKGESLWQLGRRDEAVSVWTDAVQRNARLALANNELAGAARSLGKLEEASAYEKQADQFTPNDPFYHWALGRRLQDLGMTELAEKHLREIGTPIVCVRVKGLAPLQGSRLIDPIIEPESAPA